jgi:hypothetical protein
MTSMDHAAEMIKINDQLIPVEMLSPELRRRWSIAQTRKIPNERATLMRQVQEELAAHLLLRAAPRRSVTTLGIVEEYGARFTDLPPQAQALADEAKRQQGIKESAGKRGK